MLWLKSYFLFMSSSALRMPLFNHSCSSLFFSSHPPEKVCLSFPQVLRRCYLSLLRCKAYEANHYMQLKNWSSTSLTRQHLIMEGVILGVWGAVSMADPTLTIYVWFSSAWLAHACFFRDRWVCILQWHHPHNSKRNCWCNEITH